MTPHLLEQVPAFLGGKGSDEMLLSRGQNASETNDYQVIDEVSVDVAGSAPHEFHLKAADAQTKRGFNFSLGFHSAIASFDARSYRTTHDMSISRSLRRKRDVMMVNSSTDYVSDDSFHG